MNNNEQAETDIPISNQREYCEERDCSMYYYSTVDKVVLTHSPMRMKDNQRFVTVRLERPNKSGFDYAECSLPDCTFQKIYGFSEDEVFDLTDYIRCNAILIWDYAQKGGGVNA